MAKLHNHSPRQQMPLKTTLCTHSPTRQIPVNPIHNLEQSRIYAIAFVEEKNSKQHES